jgi:hypothetical protein
MTTLTLGGEPAFDNDGAALYIGISRPTLTKWRCLGHPNIPYYLIGRKPLYKKSDLDAWLERRRKGGNGEDASADNPLQAAAPTRASPAIPLSMPPKPAKQARRATAKAARRLTLRPT